MAAVKKLQNLINLYHEEKMAHVYLIETNNMDKLYEDLINVIKNINCEKEYQENCHNCNLCNLTNLASLPSLVVIEPDGNNIKKEQVLDLKRRFSFKPIYTQNNIYIIKNADKLNGASANTMLKFIEEPGDNILGFLITTNLNNVIPTIKSRCELLTIFYDLESVNDEEIYQTIAQEYITKTELEKNAKIMYNESIILNKFNERKDIELVFKEIFKIYLAQYEKRESFTPLKNLTSAALRFRLKLLIQFLDDINTNANIELLLDKYIIELSDENGQCV